MEISPTKRGQEGGQKAQSTYVPVNTLMLRKASEGQGDEFWLNGGRVEQVQITCRVHEIREGSQRYDLTFADEFGGFKGVIYRSSKGSPRALRHFDLHTYQPSDYVTVVGHLRRFQDNAVLLVDRMEEIKTYDEVLSHRSLVLWAWAVRSGKSPVQAAKSEVLKERPHATTENKDEFAHMHPLQQDILRTLKRLMETRNSPSGGINKVEILRELRSRPMEKEFESTLQNLALFGYLMDADRDCYVPAT